MRRWKSVERERNASKNGTTGLKKKRNFVRCHAMLKFKPEWNERKLIAPRRNKIRKEKLVKQMPISGLQTSRIVACKHAKKMLILISKLSKISVKRSIKQEQSERHA